MSQSLRLLVLVTLFGFACGVPAEDDLHDEGLPESSDTTTPPPSTSDDTGAEQPEDIPDPMTPEEPAPPEEPPPEEPPPEEPPPEEPPPEEPPPEEPPPEEPPPEEPPPEEPPPEEPPPEEPPPAEPPASCPRVQVINTGGETLNVRPDPSTTNAPLGTLSAGRIVDVNAIVTGQSINGTTTWYEITTSTLHGFVSGAFAGCVLTGSAPPDVFLLPLPCGMQVRVTQGNNTDFSHNDMSAYAFDFGLASNTPLLAMKNGTVIALDESTQPGDPCYSGGGQSCINEANTVTLRHGDGTTTLYAHVNSVEVSMGQQVSRGAVVARSGGTGWSTGPHAHVARQRDCGYAFCQSIAMRFFDVPGDGVPAGGDIVTSQNGCQ